MDKFVNSKNFLFKYLILELFEKLYRLQKYTNTCKEFDAKNNAEQIITLFDSSIKIIGDEVNKLCSQINSDLSNTEKYAFILMISQHYKAIIKLHEELRNLHSSWILPEIKTFSKEIIYNKYRSTMDINIILSDNYSFLERNLGKKFESLLQEVYSSSEQSKKLKENHSFILPKIEFSNPLNWTIIVHEAGHLQNDIINKIKEDENIMPDNIQSLQMKIIKNWAEEIYCDIYATSILGPAYFLSFVSFALSSTMDYGISSSSNMHPSVMIRASIIINYLKNNSLVFNLEWGIEDYSKIFYENLIEQNNIFNDEPKNSIEGLTKFNRNLRKVIKNLDLNTFSITESDSNRIKNLLLNLNNGIPIGSVSKDIDFDIDHYLNKETLSVSDLSFLKESISERSSEIWEILNTGWIYKLETGCKKGEFIFFDESSLENDIMTKINNYGREIDFLDDRLLASINSSQIIKIIEDK